jgi:hypothetical protein
MDLGNGCFFNAMGDGLAPLLASSGDRAFVVSWLLW